MLAKRLESLNPYVPGEQPKDRVYVKLNANENPYPPSPAVSKAITEAVNTRSHLLALYPDPDSTELRQSFAQMLNKTGGVFCNGHQYLVGEKESDFHITPDMVFCGNGTDEVLSFIFYSFFGSEAPLVLPEFTYSFYPVYAGFYNIPLKRIPLKSDWSFDINTMMSEVKKDSCGMIFANPNAPTGIGLSCKNIEKMLQDYPSDKVMVVDEAYVDFGGETVLPLLSKYKNLVVVRTSSKSMSFAGMRLGFAIADPELIKAIKTVKDSFNHFPVDNIACIAGCAACTDPVYYCNTAKSVVTTRDIFVEKIVKAGWTVIPSQTNFVMATLVDKDGTLLISGQEAYQKIKNTGILVRHFSTRGIENYIRISIGTDEQMEQLAAVMSEMALIK
jgi:histidinol-phosphate aminotransferase